MENADEFKERTKERMRKRMFDDKYKKIPECRSTKEKGRTRYHDRNIQEISMLFVRQYSYRQYCYTIDYINSIASIVAILILIASIA